MSRITVEDISVKFRLYHDHSPSLKDTFANIFRKKKAASFVDFWAVRGVSFNVYAGDRLGIVGNNGAGKSTLLKALCRVYESKYGNIKVDGTVVPLLEIGAGFHPEFTGRENIKLNGSILGLNKRQISLIEPEVIDFSELDNFIDTPVKYYSTGMYMRLAFSLATAISPDILILDEIFAGGDASFMQKAKARMHEMINKANIMIMVSHDHELVRTLCNRVIWMESGKIIADGPPDEIIKKYLNS
jgi:ABC-type polysaccharide/polyol phosphate transport system ATPase subunit